MARWMFVNSRTPSELTHKYWYWVHTTADNSERRGGPFNSLLDCILDAKANGLEESSIVVPTKD